MAIAAAPLDLAPGLPERQVLDADRAFFTSYNACDVEAMAGHLAEDLEFYHDKGGLTVGRSALIASTRSGICKPGGSRLRREPVPGTINFYPLAGYGGILTGEHLFYVREPGAAERLDGQARFTHVWRFAEGNWRMTRVLSYDHGPARVAAGRAAMVAPGLLARYAGTYRSSEKGETGTIAAGQTSLSLAIGDLELELLPISETSFMAVGRNLRFDFAPGDGDGHHAISIWEDGKLVDHASRIH